MVEIVFIILLFAKKINLLKNKAAIFKKIVTNTSQILHFRSI